MVGLHNACITHPSPPHHHRHPLTSTHAHAVDSLCGLPCVAKIPAQGQLELHVGRSTHCRLHVNMSAYKESYNQKELISTCCLPCP